MKKQQQQKLHTHARAHTHTHTHTHIYIYPNNNNNNEKRTWKKPRGFQFWTVSPHQLPPNIENRRGPTISNRQHRAKIQTNSFGARFQPSNGDGTQVKGKLEIWMSIKDNVIFLKRYRSKYNYIKSYVILYHIKSYVILYYIKSI